MDRPRLPWLLDRLRLLHAARDELARFGVGAPTSIRNEIEEVEQELGRRQASVDRSGP